MYIGKDDVQNDKIFFIEFIHNPHFIKKKITNPKPILKSNVRKFMIGRLYFV